jgi:hypothetical protein
VRLYQAIVVSTAVHAPQHTAQFKTKYLEISHYIQIFNILQLTDKLQDAEVEQYMLIFSENRKWISADLTKGGKRGDTDMRKYDLWTCRPYGHEFVNQFSYYLIQKIH